MGHFRVLAPPLPQSVVLFALYSSSSSSDSSETLDSNSLLLKSLHQSLDQQISARTSSLFIILCLRGRAAKKQISNFIWSAVSLK